MWEFHMLLWATCMFLFLLYQSLAPAPLPSLIITERNTSEESAYEYGAEMSLQARI